MAFPDLVLSTIPMPAQFIGGRAFAVQKHIDFEWGPIAIQDPSKGSMYQIWRARMENDYVYLSAPNVAEFVLLDLPGVTEISFTFDQNARHIFAYVQSGVSYLRWYDTSVAAYVTTVIDGITPRVTLDDKRELQRSASDVLVFYVRAGALYMRMQRDRYGIEYHLANAVVNGLVKCGMMRNWRVGVQLDQYSHAEIL